MERNRVLEVGVKRKSKENENCIKVKYGKQKEVSNPSQSSSEQEEEGESSAGSHNSDYLKTGFGLWNVYGECENIAVMTGHTGAVIDFHFSTNGGTVFTCSTDTTVALWDLQTCQSIKKLTDGGVIESNPNNGLSLKATANQKTFSSELELTKGNVFFKLLEAFSNTNPPDRIILSDETKYNQIEAFEKCWQTKFNLTEAFEEFWETLFDKFNYLTSGYNTKVLTSLTYGTSLVAIARVLRRGWEEERFFPKQLAEPLLEACIFNRDSETQIYWNESMFYNYIEPRELKKLQNCGSTVSVESLEIFKKYCPEAKISEGDNLKSACIKVLKKVMFKDVERIRSAWTPELVGLLEYEQFKFMMEERWTRQEVYEEDVVTVAPHRIWGTFFYKWDDNKVDFYFKLLRNYNFKKCSFCGESDINAKHIISTCKSNLRWRMFKERHECALRVIARELNIALNRTSYFSSSNKWQMKIMYENYRTSWPEDLHMLEKCRDENGIKKYPNIVIWTTSPTKRALVVEITVSWDIWVPGSIHYDQTVEYKPVIDMLKLYGFEAEFRDIKLGSRGSFSEDLYKLFHEVCGLTNSKISKTMEKINKKIVEVTYNFIVQTNY